MEEVKGLMLREGVWLYW